jgi:putative flippase GtrA
VGAVSTIVFALLFWALVGPLGAFTADVVALGLCAIANTAANRRITFALRGRAGRSRHYAAGLALAALPLVASLTTLGVLQVADVTAVVPRLAALTAVNGLGTLARFVVMRRWVFGR